MKPSLHHPACPARHGAETCNHGCGLRVRLSAPTTTTLRTRLARRGVPGVTPNRYTA